MAMFDGLHETAEIETHLFIKFKYNHSFNSQLIHALACVYRVMMHMAGSLESMREAFTRVAQGAAESNSSFLSGLS